MLSALSDVAERVNGPILFITAVSMVMLIGITAVMVYFTFRYSRRRNPRPSEIHGNAMLEIVWTVVPTLLAFAMFWYGWVGYKFMKSPPADAFAVEVTGRMWSWLHEYDNGIESDELVIPVGEPVRLNLTAVDVLHSYYIPAFKVKQDAVPGIENLFLWFTPKVVGDYNVFCAEYCGLQHSGMMTMVRVLPVDEFEQWYEAGGAKVAEMKETLDAVAGDDGADNVALIAVGKNLAMTKGCIACHSVDGTKLIGPSFKGIYGMEETVITGGNPRMIVVDDEYIENSILNPNDDLVEGYLPLMPSQKGLMSDDEIRALIEYIKTLE